LLVFDPVGGAEVTGAPAYDFGLGEAGFLRFDAHLEGIFLLVGMTFAIVHICLDEVVHLGCLVCGTTLDGPMLHKTRKIQHAKL
jgi:hypothetical protein